MKALILKAISQFFEKNFSSFSKKYYDFTNCKAGNEGCRVLIGAFKELGKIPQKIM